MVVADERLFEMCNNWMYKNMDCGDWDMKAYCLIDGFWSWQDVVDSNGNLLDSVKVITVHDLQAACENVGIDIDCVNF